MKVKPTKVTMNAALRKSIKENLAIVPEDKLAELGSSAKDYDFLLSLVSDGRGFMMIPWVEDNLSMRNIIANKLENSIEDCFEEREIDKQTYEKYKTSLLQWKRIGRWIAPAKPKTKAKDDPWKAMVETTMMISAFRAIQLLRKPGSPVRLTSNVENLLLESVNANWGGVTSSSEGGFVKGKPYVRINMFMFKKHRVKPVMKHVEDYATSLKDPNLFTFYGPFDLVLTANVASTLSTAIQRSARHLEIENLSDKELSWIEVYSFIRENWINQEIEIERSLPRGYSNAPEPSPF